MVKVANGGGNRAAAFSGNAGSAAQLREAGDDILSQGFTHSLITHQKCIFLREMFAAMRAVITTLTQL